MFNVAIDGPAGAGKSSIAKAIAAKKGYIYVDTGAMYRAIGYYCLQNGIDTKDSAAVIAALDHITVDLGFDPQLGQRVYLNGEDVSESIRTPEGGMAASNVSALPQVRDFLMDAQRGLAQKYNCIMDGRDIGTVVLPNAPLKIFLTASSYVRAKRRALEFEQKGIEVDFEQLKAEIEQRDYNDSHRETAPLKQADDAVLVDTSDMTFDEVVSAIEKLIEERV
ncbi:MAG: (d)CMP kinase [Oscillospiraceae bacterium]|nr:(d)CMP kinase [Oscillospiraceae bacterium]